MKRNLNSAGLTVSPKSTKRTTTSHLKPLNKIKLFFKWLETRKESLTVLANNLTSTNINKTNKQVDDLTVQPWYKHMLYY